MQSVVSEKVRVLQSKSQHKCSRCLTSTPGELSECPTVVLWKLDCYSAPVPWSFFTTSVGIEPGLQLQCCFNFNVVLRLSALSILLTCSIIAPIVQCFYIVFDERFPSFTVLAS